MDGYHLSGRSCSLSHALICAAALHELFNSRHTVPSRSREDHSANRTIAETEQEVGPCSYLCASSKLPALGRVVGPQPVCASAVGAAQLCCII